LIFVAYRDAPEEIPLDGDFSLQICKENVEGCLAA